jgi:acyl-CoA synthetase (NDP forming)
MNMPLASSAAAKRERASAESLAALFSPKSIAVIGASSNPTRFTGKIIPTLLRQGYKGTIYPVNASRSEIAGLPCYPELSAIPGPVDCIVYALAPEQMHAALRGAKRLGAKLLVVASAGFAERGDAEGKRLQDELVALAHENGMRVIGPNCIGFANFVDRICATAAAAMNWPDIQPGRIGLVSQSGGLGFATVLFNALEEGIGFSHVVTTGNEADLDTIDIARFLVNDERTDVIAITVEAVRDPAGFIEFLGLARRAGKPVVVLKSGRTDLGKVMAASHTGALAGSAEVFEAVCRQFGVTCTHDVDEFYQICAMFGKLRAAGKLQRSASPASKCTAFSISGGHIGLFADHASTHGLKFAPFSEKTREAITRELGFDGNFQNPLDTTARAIGDDGFWGRCLRVMLEDESVDVAIPIITVAHSYDRAIEDFINLAERSDKIVTVLWAGGCFDGNGMRLLRESNVPVFRTAARAARAIEALDRYCTVQHRAAKAQQVAARGNAEGMEKARALLRKAAATGQAALTERESKEVLTAIGFPATKEQAVALAADAVAAARSIGFPVALKGEHPDIMHKSEAGIVFLGLKDEQAVAAAFDTIVERMQKAVPGDKRGRVLVQEMLPQGTELILGLTRDPEFGLVALCGLGGIFVEILNDVAMRLPPFSHDEAKRMIGELRGVKVLQGARGREPVDLDRVADLLVALGDFAVANSDLIREVDINPLIALGGDRLRMADALIVLNTAR